MNQKWIEENESEIEVLILLWSETQCSNIWGDENQFMGEKNPASSRKLRATDFDETRQN